MKFIFQAKNSLGEIKEGKIEAVSKESAIASLQGKGFLPLSVEQESVESPILLGLQKFWEGVNLRELSVFFRQLSTLIEARVSIVASLRAVGEQTSNKYLKNICLEMVNDIEDGSPLSEAMSKFPETFKPLMVSMIKAGELSGNLQKSVLFLAENSEKNYDLNARVRSALFYPVFVLSAALIIGFVVFTVVLPKLTSIFKDMNVEIPWYTKMFMNAGDFMSSYWWMILIGIVITIGAGIYYLDTEDGKKEWDLLKMKIPVVGDLFKFIYIARFTENLSVLLNGGIPIVRALVIVSEVVNSSTYEAVILRAADEVKTGGSMSSVFAKSEHFPPIVPQMIKIGEDAGKMADVLLHISEFYSKETDRIARNFATMIEPLLIVVLGLGVGILVFAILMPIYNISSSIN